MKITIPHIHKIEGDAGFWAKVAKEGKVEELRIKTYEGLRQIEGILIGRKAQEIPLVVARICGICPVVHILNACCALEKILEIKVSPLTVLIRKLFLSSQMIQSHTLHLFFLSLADFSNIENDLDLMKKFKKEAKAALKIRDFSMEVTEIIGGRKVHPVTPHIGEFLKLPEKEELIKVFKELPAVLESAEILAKTFSKLPYPNFHKHTHFASLLSQKEYPFYHADFISIETERITPGDFYSNQIEEDLKVPPVKKVKWRGHPYMLGAIARLSNNHQFLTPLAKEYFEGFKKKNKLSNDEFFGNIFYNLFSQVIEALNFLELSKSLIKEILERDLKEERKEYNIKAGSGLSAMEAPRGTLFTYFEIDKNGRIVNCNIVTPTAQFLPNMEEDLKIILPDLLKLKEEDRKRKIRALIRVYDPCISCSTH